MRIRFTRMLFILALVLSSCGRQPEKEQASTDWPVIKSYDQAHLYQVALPLGGIGTGTVSLGGRGELRDWEIMNRPAKGFNTTGNLMNAPFFAIYTKTEGSEPVTKALLGPLYEWEYQHMEGRSVPLHGLPRFEHASFDAAYPFGQVHLTDSNLPVDVTLKAFNPLVPCEPEASGLPVAVLYYEVKNKTDKSVIVSISGTMRNFVGCDGSKREKDWKGELIPVGSKANKNMFTRYRDIQGLYMYSDGVDRKDPAWGTIALSTAGEDTVTYRTGSVSDNWSNSIKDFWKDFSEDGELTEREFPADDQPMGSLAIKDTIDPGASRFFRFVITWHFPNRTDWWGKEIIGNYYTGDFQNAWDVSKKIIPYLPDLEAGTLKFVRTLMNSKLPQPVLEAALFNLSTLRSQTVFRTPDGKMYGWEGCMDDVGSCWGSCTHVWNYEQATPFLFGKLARTMREVEFEYATDTITGLMSFRVGLPLKDARTMKVAAADGQMGTIMKFYRDWQLSGDSAFLVKHWNNVKKALSFCWIPGGWDANKDGVMEGIQHNTMDVEYYGPNPQMQIWYLGALKAAGEMAKAMNDVEFRGLVTDLFNKGSEWTDKNLFNGEYYEQIIMVPEEKSSAAGFAAGMGSGKKDNPDYQLGKGCLVDQLVGQYMAHVCGLGYLVNEENVRKTLVTISKLNYFEKANDHFNNMRSYALGNESGLMMASWPKGQPAIPFPYYSEVMTGFEYTAAAGMLYEGLYKEGLKTITDIRNRYDGLKRNPFNEAECGYHYARAMASWASVLALTRFRYSGVEESMQINSEPGTYFWSNGYAWGECEVSSVKGIKQVTIRVFGGELKLKKFLLPGFGDRIISDKSLMIKSGEETVLSILPSVK